MGLIALLRLLTLLLVLWIVGRFLRGPPADPRADSSSRRSSQASHMVQCQMCRTHVPESEAIRQGAHWFCNTRHRDQFQQES